MWISPNVVNFSSAFLHKVTKTWNPNYISQTERKMRCEKRIKRNTWTRGVMGRQNPEFSKAYQVAAAIYDSSRLKTEIMKSTTVETNPVGWGWEVSRCPAVIQFHRISTPDLKEGNQFLKQYTRDNIIQKVKLLSPQLINTKLFRTALKRDERIETNWISQNFRQVADFVGITVQANRDAVVVIDLSVNTAL